MRNGILEVPVSCPIRSASFTIPSRSRTTGDGIQYSAQTPKLPLPPAVAEILTEELPEFDSIEIRSRRIGDVSTLLREQSLERRIDPLETSLSSTHVLALGVLGGVAALLLSNASCCITLLCRWRRRLVHQRLALTAAENIDMQEVALARPDANEN